MVMTYSRTSRRIIKKQERTMAGMHYRIDDNPPWSTTILLAFQHYFLFLSTTLAAPLIIVRFICADDMSVTSIISGNMQFACGLSTILQTLLGVRLPIAQCPAFAFLAPLVALQRVPDWTCTDKQADQDAGNNSTEIMNGENVPVYVDRMNLLTGSIMAAVVLEIIIGASGLIAVILKYIGPLTITPTIMLIGLAVGDMGFEMAGKHWAISGGTVVLTLIFSEMLPTISVPNPFSRNCVGRVDLVFHKMFPIIFSASIMWLVCFILILRGDLPSDSTQYGYFARSDLHTATLRNVSWIRIPYPGYFGRPGFSASIFAAALTGIIPSVIESIGDYYACAKMAGAAPPPPHAINRGIMIEGINCLVASSFGTGFGVTSSSQNIGVISLTKVGSRRVVLVAGGLMMVFGCCGKFSAMVISVPVPIVGGIFLVLFGILVAVGASNICNVNMGSTRNLAVLGISLVFGLSLPNWVKGNVELINTGSLGVDQVICALLANNMFVGAVIAVTLDNSFPGSKEERGFVTDISTTRDDTTVGSLESYNVPFTKRLLRRYKWLTRVPFLPDSPAFQFHPVGHVVSDVSDTNIAATTTATTAAENPQP